MPHTIEDEVRKIIAGVGRSKGADPVLGIAVADVESGFNPHAVGDTATEYASFGVFQERLKVGRGGFTTPDPDPARQADRFYDDVLRYMRAGGAGTPGEVAAAVQRPADPVAYAEKVDRRYRFHMSDPEIRSEPSGGAGPRPTSAAPAGRPHECNPFDPVCQAVAKIDPHTCNRFDPACLQARIHAGLEKPPAQEAVDAVAKKAQEAVDAALGPVAGAIERARQGAAQVVIGVAVVGTAIVLGYTGVRKVLG